MKKIVLLVMLVLSVSLFSLDHGLISGFEVGYNLINVNLVRKNDIIINDISSDSLYLQLKTGYRVENLRIIGTYTNTMDIYAIDYYTPIQDRFKIELNYTLGNFTIGAFHWCSHPVSDQNDTRIVTTNEGQRAIYVRFYKEF